MDKAKILEMVWTFVNSPTGIVLLSGMFLWAINKVYAKKPAWKQFEGLIVAGCKHAEKLIPDDTESKGLRRFDAALKFILKIYEKSQGKQAPASVVESIKEGINLVHNKLDKDGTL